MATRLNLVVITLAILLTNTPLTSSDEHACCSDPCKNGGTCVVEPGRYTCKCLDGFSGVNCDERKECSMSKSDDTKRAGQADRITNAIPESQCKDRCLVDTNCDSVVYSKTANVCYFFLSPGNVVSGVTDLVLYKKICKGVQVKEPCADSPCTNGGTCTKEQGTDYKCTCSYQFSGKNCESVFDVNNCTLTVLQGRKRTDSPFGTGTNFDLKTCRESCGNNPGCLEANHVGTRCEQYSYPDPARVVPDNNVTLVRKICQFTTDINECNASSCQHCGVCKDKFRGYDCRCHEGFVGDHCEKDVINECASNPCTNGGTCSDVIQGYTCKCPEGFAGDRCETDNVKCNGCSGDNGVCLETGTGYQCRCKNGYIGTHCETDIDECSSAPCQNGATCTDEINKFICRCKTGYIGFLCDKEINECSSNPCQNGATCRDRPGNYECSCIPGFTGANCETDINECGSNPCQHSGRCVEELNRYYCNCPLGYAGINCEKDMVKICSNTTCYNSGTCLLQQNVVQCACPKGLSGRFCETDLRTTTTPAVTKSTPPSTGSPPGVSVEILAAAVGGSVLATALLIGVIYACCRREKKSDGSKTADTSRRRTATPKPPTSPLPRPPPFKPPDIRGNVYEELPGDTQYDKLKLKPEPPVLRSPGLPVSTNPHIHSILKNKNVTFDLPFGGAANGIAPGTGNGGPEDNYVRPAETIMLSSWQDLAPRGQPRMSQVPPGPRRVGRQRSTRLGSTVA